MHFDTRNPVFPRLGAVALIWLWLLATACAQLGAPEFPTRPISLVIPWPAGTYADAVGRPVAEIAGRNLGQPVTVSNVPGAAGALGPSQVAQAPKDGYTLVQMNPGSLTILPNMQKLQYSLDTWEPIAQFATDPYVLLVPANSTETAQQFIERAKKSPGSIAVATGGVGSGAHLSLVALGIAAGGEFKHVPYQSSSEGVNALIGGHVMGAVSTTRDVEIHVKEGRLKALIVFSEQRSPKVANAPTATELGYKVVGLVWQGAAAAAGTPAPVLAKLRDAFAKAMKSEELAATYDKLNATVAFLGAEEFKSKWQAESEMYRKAIEAAGLRDSANK